MATFITDASWEPHTLRATWAGCCITHLGRETFSGVVKGSCCSSNEAELIAIVNTVHCAVRRPFLPPKYGWLLQTDNLHCVNLINFHHQSKTKWAPKVAPKTTPKMEKVLEHLATLDKTHTPDFIYARHVKGHVAETDRLPRHHVQERMDQLATARRIS